MKRHIDFTNSASQDSIVQNSASSSTKRPHTESTRKLTHPEGLPPRSNLNAAKEALLVTRAIYKKPGNFKSHNKWHNDRNYSSEVERLKQANSELLRIKNFPSSQWIDILPTALTHNCTLLALLASHSARSKGYVAEVAKTKVHSFTVIGPVHQEIKNLPRNMEKWPNDIAICDPWANTACQANEYPAHFQAKMEKWQNNKKQILMNGDWIEPTNISWITSVLHEEKNKDIFK